MVVFIQPCATTKLGSRLTAGKGAPAYLLQLEIAEKVTYFEMSKASVAVAADLYKVAKSCYSISGRVLQNCSNGI